jgi:adenosylcobyric acid synthase
VLADIDIAVIKLPRISNFTDFNAFELILGAKVRYISSAKEFKCPDLLILPGTKNTIDDLKWMRECGIEAEILKYASRGNPVFGICGGYQMLCKSLKDPYNVEGGEIKGLGLIDAHTVFEKEKTRTRVSGIFKCAGGIFSELNGKSFEGYEIHMGITKAEGFLSMLKSMDGGEKTDGLCQGNVYGSYVHGIFDSEEVLKTIIKALYNKKGLEYNETLSCDVKAHKEREYDKLADELRKSLDMKYIYKIIDEGVTL